MEGMVFHFSFVFFGVCLLRSGKKCGKLNSIATKMCKTNTKSISLNNCVDLIDKSVRSVKKSKKKK